MKIFFLSIKCHTFSEQHARSDLNDDNNNGDDNDKNHKDDNNSDNINKDNKEEDADDEKYFFSNVSNVTCFLNHKLRLI